jgi:hypothetical protein
MSIAGLGAFFTAGGSGFLGEFVGRLGEGKGGFVNIFQK